MKGFIFGKTKVPVATCVVLLSLAVPNGPSWATTSVQEPAVAPASGRGPAIPPVLVPPSTDGRKVKVEVAYPAEDCVFDKTSAGYELLEGELVASQGGHIVDRGSAVRLRPGTYTLKVTIKYRTCRNTTSLVAVPEGLFTLESSDWCYATAVNFNRAAGPPLMAAYSCYIHGERVVDHSPDYYRVTGSVGYQWDQVAPERYTGDMYLDGDANELKFAEVDIPYDPESAPGALYFDETLDAQQSISLPAQEAVKNNWVFGPTRKKSVVQVITVTSRNSPCVSSGEPGRLRLGMTAAEVSALIGYGGRRALYLNQAGTVSETRTYEWCSYSNVLYVYFRDGRVSGWLDS